MYHRRRRSHSTPTAPVTTSPDPTLAAAAAGTALRHATPTPIGTIPTKRMLKRRDSYSSTSDGGGGAIQRSNSLTDRRLRKVRGGTDTTHSIGIGIGRRASTGSRSLGVSMPRKVTAYHEEGEDSSEDYPADDDSDLHLPLPPLRPFPTTLRNGGGGGSGSRALKKLVRPRETSAPSSRPSRRHSLDYEDSSASLESIAEDRTLPSPLAPALTLAPAAPLPAKILEESDGSDSDSTTRRGKHTLLSLPRHSPPARSTSPAKSALRNTAAAAAASKPPRVSFSDEDSIAGFPAYAREPPRARYSLPVFGAGGVTAPSPPPSDSSQESIIGLESALRYPKGLPPLGAGSAVKRLLSGGRPPPPLGGAKERRPEERAQTLYDSDSDESGGSIYSDAFEDLSMYTFGALPGILEVAPPPPPPPPPQERLHSSLIVRPTSFRPPSITSLSSTSTTSVHRLTPRDRSSPAARMLASSLRARGVHVRTHSRFSTDSDLPVVIGGHPGSGMGVVERGVERVGSGGTVKRRRGWWGALKKAGAGKLRRRSTGGVGVGKEVEVEVEVEVEQRAGKRKRLWRVKRLLGLK